jgi:hypothetical protein
MIDDLMANQHKQDFILVDLYDIVDVSRQLLLLASDERDFV